MAITRKSSRGKTPKTRRFSSSKRIIFIVGPTGVGKTELGITLARLLPCEFVSADSMQVYKGMDVVTDKLPGIVREKFPCRLLDVVSPSGDFDVARYCAAARSAIKRIWAKKKMAVVIGGTGLYVDSLLYGIFREGAKNEKVRKRLETEAEEKGLFFLYQKLKKVDPAAAGKIDPHDARRITRALEVYEATGKPISALQKQRRGLADECDVLIFGLRRKRESLYRRIDQRVDFMVNSGLLDEVRRLLKKRLSRTAYYCIGIREMEGFLRGSYGFDEAVRLMKRNSRRFAKRQMTWFNKSKDIAWLDLEEGEDLAPAARKIYERIVGR